MRADILRLTVAILVSVFASAGFACDEYKQQQAAAQHGTLKPRIEVINYDVSGSDNRIAQKLSDNLQGSTPVVDRSEQDFE